MRRPWAAVSALAALHGELLRIVWGFALAISLLIVARLFVFDLVSVEGSSMEPTLREGRVIVVNKLAYGVRRPFRFGYLLKWATPQSGDVVAARNPQTGALIVKRIAAEPDTPVGLHGSLLAIKDGTGIRSLTVFGSARRYFSTIAAVPKNMVLIVGDSPTYSVDSRHFGPVSLDLISGRVTGTANATGTADGR